MNIGDTLPKLPIRTTDANIKNLEDLAGNPLVLYFYPKDNTPGCTMESQNFRDLYTEFQNLNTEIIGVSRDSLASHERFREKQALPFTLISDSEETLCQYFDVIKMKNMYGKQVMGIERSTFLFDETGHLVKEWRKVKVKGHVEEVLQAVQELQA